MNENGKTVMIVDDSSFLRNKLRKILESHGFSVICEAANGQEALTQFLKHEPDIITMDIVMPGVDGIETLKKIKAKNPSAIVIMVTSMGLEEKVIASLKAGANNFVVKPFDEGNLIGVLKTAVV